jgi:hypothetical protein
MRSATAFDPEIVAVWCHEPGNAVHAKQTHLPASSRVTHRCEISRYFTSLVFAPHGLDEDKVASLLLLSKKVRRGSTGVLLDVPGLDQAETAFQLSPCYNNDPATRECDVRTIPLEPFRLVPFKHGNLIGTQNVLQIRKSSLCA